ncbi:MAG: SufD family Fe-S cluster assembly protein, partial [Pseudomonadota bacterium]
GGASGGEGNAASRITVGDGALLTHVKVAVEDDVRHVGNWAAKVGSDAKYRPFLFTAGPALARNNLFIAFAGEGSALNASGAFLGRDRQHIDNTLWIDHDVPSCESRELFKGVLDDHARGIFQGKVVVQPVAQKTDGKQMAQALMLSPTCEFDSKPELEIYADDVVCGHGSTCAELDSDLVFYLRSRGIPEATAKTLLMESFVGEAIEEIENDAVAEAVAELANSWLSKLAA